MHGCLGMYHSQKKPSEELRKERSHVQTAGPRKITVLDQHRSKDAGLTLPKNVVFTVRALKFPHFFAKLRVLPGSIPQVANLNILN